MLDALVRDIRAHDNANTAGDVGYRYVLRALADNLDRSVNAVSQHGLSAVHGPRLVRAVADALAASIAR